MTQTVTRRKERRRINTKSNRRGNAGSVVLLRPPLCSASTLYSTFDLKKGQPGHLERKKTGLKTLSCHLTCFYNETDLGLLLKKKKQTKRTGLVSIRSVTTKGGRDAYKEKTQRFSWFQMMYTQICLRSKGKMKGIVQKERY